MNTIYLMVDEKRYFALVKVGFATDMENRVYAYTTHNPLATCVSTIKTMEKSKRKVENAFHQDLKDLGYEQVIASIDGKKTEWFKIDYDDPFYTKIETFGLNAFKSGKNRKNNGLFTL